MKQHTIVGTNVPMTSIGAVINSYPEEEVLRIIVCDDQAQRVQEFTVINGRIIRNEILVGTNFLGK